MEESAVKARIVDRMTILKVYVSVRAAHDLSDVASALEVLYCEVLNLTKGWDLTSANYPSLNSPAVDLHDKGRRIAVQITATCDTKKITETQETWERNGLSAAYDELIFVGVKSVQKSKYLKPWANIYTQEDLLNLSNLNLSQLRTLDERLAQSINWDQYTNESDSHCFDVVLGVLDRDAIRHATMVEGNFDDMLDAIRKIKQIINQGLIEGSGQRAKPLSLYGPEYADILETIDIHVGQISSIVRRNYNPHHQLLPWEAAAKVDQERTVMVDAVNKFAEAHGHTRRIAVWHGY